MQTVSIVWLIVAISLVAVFIAVLVKKIRPVILKLFMAALVLVFALGSALYSIMPFNDPIAPTGDHEFEQVRVGLEHPTIFTAYETSPGKRFIPLHFWYPEGEGKFPLVLYSHGAFGMDTANESLFQELASHGYIVASISHPKQSFMSVMPGGKMIWNSPAYVREALRTEDPETFNDLEKTYDHFDNWLSIRLEDINYVLDQIVDDPDQNEMFKKIDTDHIILAGFSLGGSAMLEIGRDRADQIDAVIALESEFFGDIQAAAFETLERNPDPYPTPVLHFYSDATWPHLKEWPVFKTNAELLEAPSPQFESIHISGSGHLGLSELILISPIITNFLDDGMDTRDLEEKFKLINQSTLDYLEALPTD